MTEAPGKTRGRASAGAEAEGSHPPAYVERTRVAISVFRPDFTPEDLQLLQGQVEQYLARLLLGLNLPATAEVEVSSEAAKKAITPFAMRINGRSGRVAPAIGTQEQTGVPEFAIALCEAVFANRELMVTPALSRRVQAILAGNDTGDVGAMSDASFHRVLEHLVWRGFSPDRCERLAMRDDVTMGDPVTYVDAVTGHVECPRIIAAMSQSNLDRIQRLSSDEASASASDGPPASASDGPPASASDGPPASASDGPSVSEEMELMREGLFWELGIIVPDVSLEVDDTLEGEEIRLWLNDLCCPDALGLKADSVLVNDTVDGLEALKIPAEKAVNPTNGAECAIIQQSDAERCRQAGLAIWNAGGYLSLLLAGRLRQHAGSYLTRDLVANNLDTLDQHFPELVTAVRRQVDEARLTTVLKCLLDEQITIKDLPSILDELLLIGGATQVDLSAFIVLFADGSNLVPASVQSVSDLGPADLADYLRATVLKRTISHKYMRGGSTLVVYLVDPETEARLRQPAALDDEERAALIAEVAAEVGTVHGGWQIPVILTSYEVRRRLRSEICKEFGHLAVLSYQELSPDINIQPLARISAPLHAYDELYYRLLHELPSFSERELTLESARVRAAGGRERSAVLGLEQHSEEIIRRVAKRIHSSHPLPKHPELQEALERLLAKFVDVYVGLLATGDTGALETLCLDLAPFIDGGGTRISHLCQIPLELAQEARRLLAQNIAEAKEDDAMKRLSERTDQFDATARQMARRFLEASHTVRHTP